MSHECDRESVKRGFTVNMQTLFSTGMMHVCQITTHWLLPKGKSIC